VAALVTGLATSMFIWSPGAGADGPTTFSNAGSISFPDVGNASPYQSDVAVSGMAGQISAVTATFTNLSHGSVNDIDALLVGPAGQNIVLLSDVGGTDNLVTATNINMTFSDAAAGPVPVSFVLPSGTYKPTNDNSAGPDSFPGPAPAPSANTTLAGAFSGTNPNGTWKLFLLDDTSGDAGSIAGGWSLTITTTVAAAATTTAVTSSVNPSQTGSATTFTATVTSAGSPVTAGTVTFTDGATTIGGPATVDGSGQAALTTSALAEGTHQITATYSGTGTFLTSNGTVSQVVDNATTVAGHTYCNTGALTIPALGPAAPYASHISVSGLGGPITGVTAQLKGVTHTSPVDLDAMLVGPAGQNLTILSDVGGTTGASGVNVTLDDAAASPVSTTSLVSGTFRPTNDTVDGADTFPAPAPAPSAATALSTFNGTSGNGTWSLYVNDDASGDSGSIANGWCLTILAAAPSTTVLGSSLNPSTVGDNVTFTATVTSGGNPVTAGTVDFKEGATVLAAAVPVNASGVATFSTNTLTAGSHPLTAIYSGTTDFQTSTGLLTQVVNKIATTTGVSSSLNPSITGQSVTFTATVTSLGSPVTTGTIDFKDGATTLAAGLVPDAAGQAAFTTSSLAIGTHPISAIFNATATLATSTHTVSQVVNPLGATITALTSSLNPSVTGQSVTFTATVTSGGSPVLVGTVTFTEGATTLASGVVPDGSGQAAFTTSGLAIGTHPITATYSGTASLATSTDTVSQVVQPLGVTNTVVSSSLNPSLFGDLVTFTATVTAGGNPVTTGTIDFTEGAVTLASGVTLDGTGHAGFSASGLAVGSHTITGTFSGTPVLATSAGSLTQVVNLIPTTTALTSSVNPSVFGQSATFTATVSTVGGPVTTGTVTIKDNGTTIGSGTPDSAGVFFVTTTVLTVGSHAITADFGLTATLAASADALTQVVEPDPTTTALTSSVNPAIVGQSVTFTATVTFAGSPVPTGTVTFQTDGVGSAPVALDPTGKAAMTTNSLSAGSHAITATFDGTPLLAASTASLTQDVGPVAVAGGPYTVAEGASLALDATGSSTGAGVSYAWDVNGNAVFTDATGLTPTLTWADLEALGINDGPFTGTVVVKVTEAGVSTTASVALTVTNTGPITTIAGSLSVTAGKPFTVKIGADDPSSADAAALFSYRVDWGDGSVVQTASGPADPPFSHTYTSPGTYSASLTATDKDGGAGAPRSVSVVAAAAPTTAPTATPTTPAPTTPAPSGLPDTGASIGMPLSSAIALIVLGVAALLVASRLRRPRRH
jgi:subtilisin-like proprotein convertase family protein